MNREKAESMFKTRQKVLLHATDNLRDMSNRAFAQAQLGINFLYSSKYWFHLYIFFRFTTIVKNKFYFVQWQKKKKSLCLVFMMLKN